MPRLAARIAVLACTVAALTLQLAARAADVPPARDVVSAAVAQAAATNRSVLIEFGASWCTWCRSFQVFVASPDAGPVIASHYVVVNLTVHERDDKTALENPGGSALMDGWGGGTAGLPYYVFLDGTGRKLADSNAMPNGGNIGFPAVPAEIAAFMRLIDRTAPRLTPAARGTLEQYLTRVMPSPAR